MAETICPPLATRPDEVCALVCDALSDGDLDAALAQYEPGATISAEPGQTLHGHGQISKVLAGAAASRALFTVLVEQILVGDGVALVLGRWHGGPSAAAGRYVSVTRQAADGHWRIALEATVPDGVAAPGRGRAMRVEDDSERASQRARSRAMRVEDDSEQAPQRSEERSERGVER